MKQSKSSVKKNESPLLRQLQAHDRDDLARLIVKLVETEPKLRPVVRQLLGQGLSTAEIVKVQQAVAALLKKFWRASNPGSYARLRRDLEFHLRSAANLASERPFDSGRIYAAILRGMMEVESDIYGSDEDAHLDRIVQQCMEGLRPLLASAPDELRQEWLQVACDAYLYDLQMGGCDFAYGSEELLEKATPDEWPAIEQRLDAFLAPSTQPLRKAIAMSSTRGTYEIEIPLKSDWALGQVVELKARRLKKSDPLAASRLVLEQGTPEQRVEILLESSEFDLATGIAEQYFGKRAGLLVSFADKLLMAGQWERAKEWAQRKGLTEWLARRTLERKDPEALQLFLELFNSRPSLERWYQVLEAAPKTTQKKVQAELWQELEKRSAFAIQFDIKLKDNELSEALTIWSRLNSWEKDQRHEVLATTTEATHTDVAKELWIELAEEQIGRRTRSGYQYAAQILSRVKKLFHNQGQDSDWDRLISDLRLRYQNLPALKEELNRAQL